MEKILGYVRALRNYLRTEKGRHDFLDYLRAWLIILATALIIWGIFGLR